MIPVVSFIGKSNSGKTTLLTRVVRELKSRGYRVAAIKHSHHDFDIDQPGKDTWRLAQAGSDVVAISSPNRVAFIERVDTELTLEQIEGLMAGKVDIVLAEGYKNGNTAKILVLGTEHDQDNPCRQEEALATISAHLSSAGVPQFDDNDVARIVNLVVEQMGENSPGKFETAPHAFEELLAESALEKSKVMLVPSDVIRSYESSL